MNALQYRVRRLAPLLLLVVAVSTASLAQAAQPSAASAPPATAKAAALFDLTGQWVAIVNEEWRWRMVTPAKGDFASIAGAMTAESRRVAGLWDPAEDGSCKAYGAAGLMRLPLRVRISWEGERVLKLETDAGQQTRRFQFDHSKVAGAASLQGHSVAEWQRSLPPPGALPGSPADALPRPGGSLLVTTQNLSPGWLRRNGVPYGDRASVTEYYDRFTTPGGDEWFVVTTLVEDPVYLNQRFITTSNFRREKDSSKWFPKACKG